jgi:predicted dehydrogenase
MTDATTAPALAIGVIGCGRVAAERHLPALARLPEVRVAALSDLDRDRLRAVAAQYGVVGYHPDYGALLADPAVEAVAVCVPAAAHAEVVCAALAAGKHVLVEKPLALTLADCDRMIAAAAAARRTIMVGFNLRLHRLVQAARAAVRTGALGRVHLVRTTLSSTETPADGGWRRRRPEGGGTLLEKAIHHVDLWHFLLDDAVDEVTALTRSEQADDEVTALTARLRAGTLAATVVVDDTAPSHVVEIFGDRGRLHVDLYRFDGLAQWPRAVLPGDLGARARQLAGAIRALPRALRARRRGGDYGATYEAQWRQFVAAIRHGAPVSATLADGRRALAVVLAAAHGANRTVRVTEAPGTVTPVSGPTPQS